MSWFSKGIPERKEKMVSTSKFLHTSNYLEWYMHLNEGIIHVNTGIWTLSYNLSFMNSQSIKCKNVNSIIQNYTLFYIAFFETEPWACIH